MVFKSIALAVSTLILSTMSNAAVITHGNLTTDDSTNYITDTSTGRQYLRFDTFDLTYAETVMATSSGGSFDGWTIATSDIADDFYSAVLGVVTTPCSGEHLTGIVCGTLDTWNNSDFGASYTTNEDHFWYISTNTTADSAEEDIGLGSIFASGAVWDNDDWNSISIGDSFSTTSGTPINALVYRDASVVPIPSAVWLFGSGLIGLIGLARRKSRN